MNVLLNAQEAEIQVAVAQFLNAECPPSLIRELENDYSGFSRPLWERFAALGWLTLCLPEEQGGQALPVAYLGLVLEELGRSMAPLPVHSTMASALILARHGNAMQRDLLAKAGSGQLILSFAIAEASGAWDAEAIRLQGKREGNDIVLTGHKYFVDNFGVSDKCLVAFRDAENQLSIVLVDTSAPGLSVERLRPADRGDECAINFDHVRVPAANVVGKPGAGEQAVDDLMDYAAVLLASQMQGAARRAMELAVDYVNQREAFGQPIGAFQAMQHMAADMLNAVDGVQLLSREALWRLDQGLPAQAEISQAKSFANGQCVMVCRAAQQMHGGLGFIVDCDINLWYRRVMSWSLRCGTTYEHRARIARYLLDAPGEVRLDKSISLPAVSANLREEAWA